MKKYIRETSGVYNRSVNAHSYVNASDNDAEYAAKNQFAQRIPLDELFDYLRNITGIPDLQFETKISNKVGSPDVFFISNDVSDKIGWLSCIFSKVRLVSISRTINVGKNFFERRNDHGREFKANTTGDYKYWVWVGVEYTPYENPSTSPRMGFLTAQYSDAYGWEFALEKER
jgi:hypothetical protein